MENELDKLRIMLREANIPFEDIQQKFAPELIQHYDTEYNRLRFGDNWIWDRNQIVYAPDGYRLMDGICQYGSYGSKEGLIETYYELGWDEHGNPQVMTAEEAFAIIKEDWEERRGKK